VIKYGQHKVHENLQESNDLKKLESSSFYNKKNPFESL